MTTQKFLDEKLRRVKDFFYRYQEALARDETLNTLLERYRKAFEDTQAAFVRAGIDRLCAECGKTTKVCCGLGMELYCEDALLVLNLYLGYKFPEKRLKDHWCFFLREDGCSLLVRPLLCRNFFCDELQESLPHEELVRVQEALGPEAEVLFALLERVKVLCPGL